MSSNRNRQVSMTRAEMDEGIAGFNQLLTKLQSTVDGMQGKFSVAIEAGFLGDSISTISKQTSSIGNSVNTIKNTINNNVNDMYNIDMKGAEKFEAIEIPTDFYANNDAETNEYNKVLLDKMDNKSVNEGELTDSVDVEGDETTVKGVELTDITGEAGSEHDRQRTKIDKEVIGDISKNGDKGVEVDAESNVVNTGMQNINNGNGGSAIGAENSHVNQAGLGQVNTSATSDSAQVSGVNTQKETLQSLAAIGGLGAVAQGAQAENIIATTTNQPSGSSESAPVNREDPPLVNAAYGATGSGNSSTKQAAVDFGAVAGLAGAVGLGLAGIAGSKDKEKEEDEDKKDNVTAVSETPSPAVENKEEKKDDTNHLSE